MAINYPGSLDDTTSLPTRSTGNTIPATDSNDPKSAIIQLETKLGTGASTPTTAGHVLAVTGAGATEYRALAEADINDLGDYATSTELTDGLGDKQDTLVSGTNIKTVNGSSLLGSGDLVIEGGGGGGATTPRHIISLHDFEADALTVKSEVNGNITASTSGYSRLVLDAMPDSRAGFSLGVDNGPFNPMAKNLSASGRVGFMPWSNGDFKFIWEIGFGAWDGAVTFAFNNHHAGFYYTRSGTTNTVYASSGDGTTYEQTDITASVSPDVVHMLYVLVSGGEALFYVDGTLVATHTTNVPVETWGHLFQTGFVGTTVPDAGNECQVHPITVSYDAY